MNVRRVKCEHYLRNNIFLIGARKHGCAVDVLFERFVSPRRTTRDVSLRFLAKKNIIIIINKMKKKPELTRTELLFDRSVIVNNINYLLL
jgi:hypothetical protein